MAIKPNPGILDIAPYKGGEGALPGFDRVIKLASNENPLGASPAAQRAFAHAQSTLHLYPDGSARALREAIGRQFLIDPERIVCGAGSDELIQLLARAYLQPGDAILQSQYGFLVYQLAAKTAGAAVIVAPDKAGPVVDVDAMIARLTPQVKLVFLANPNNPTGTYIADADVKRLHAALPPSALLVLDSAYAEYMTQQDYDAGVEMVTRAGNVVMLRTFSKIHGLAGLRVGWAYGPPDVIDVLNRIRGPFNVGAQAQATAVAALGDLAFAAQSRAHNDQQLALLQAALTDAGYGFTPSVTNFVLVHFDSDGSFTADACDAFLRARGIIVRRVSAYGLPDALRISVGSADENSALIAALRAFRAA